jgi:hypothetical protein
MKKCHLEYMCTSHMIYFGFEAPFLPRWIAIGRGYFKGVYSLDWYKNALTRAPYILAELFVSLNLPISPSCSFDSSHHLIWYSQSTRSNNKSPLKSIYRTERLRKQIIFKIRWSGCKANVTIISRYRLPRRVGCVETSWGKISCCPSFWDILKQ